MSKSKKHIMSDNSSEVSEDEEYEVEKILKMRINPKTKKKEYLVKWESKQASKHTHTHTHIEDGIIVV